MQLVALFDRVCLPSHGDPTLARQAAKTLSRMTGPAASHLLIRPGAVYDASTPAGHMALLSFDDGTCGTVADDVDAGSLLGELARQMKRRGVSVTAIGSAPAGAAHAYRLRGGGIRLSLMVDMQSDDGRTQASMLAVRDGG
jgi:hypothetical protein